MKTIKLISILLLCLYSSGLSQNGLPVRNSDFLAGLMADISDEIADYYSLETGTAVYCSVSHDSEPVRNYLMDKFYSTLIEKGVTVSMKPVDERAAKLLITIVYFDLNYGKLFRRKIFGSSYTERQGILRVSTRYIRGNMDQTIDIEEFTGTRKDTLRFTELARVEKSSFFPVPARPAEPGIRRWIEPISLGLALAGLSYAFYTVRSQ